MATKFPDVVLKPFAQQLVQGLQSGACNHYAYFLNDLGAEAPRSAKRYAQVVADAGGMSVKELFGGFCPVWTRRKADIASFFGPAQKGTKRKESEQQANPSGGKQLDGKNCENGSLVGVGVEKDNGNRRKLNATETITLSPKAGIEKTKASPLRKKAVAKKGVKSITDYFPVCSGKSSGG